MSTKGNNKKTFKSSTKGEMPVDADIVSIGETDAFSEDVKKSSDVKDVVQKAKIAPRVFIKASDRIVIDVACYYNNLDGEFAFVIPVEFGSEIDNIDASGDLWTVVPMAFEFTRVTYDKLNRYRSSSMVYNSEDQNNTINLIKLHDFFLVYHLVDWDLTDEDGQKIKLKFDTNGALSDESLSLVYSLSPMILDLVFTLYKKKMNIS